MKIIFLDIDGVLNSQLFYTEKSQEVRDNESGGSKGSDIDERNVSYLNNLIEETGAKVVISSTWRHSGLDYCRQALEEKGFKGEIIDITPCFNHEGGVRGNEIYHWIQKNAEMLCGSRIGSDFKEYVIFDDDSDMLLWQAPHFIKVDAYCGLTPNQCYQARFILCRDFTFSAMVDENQKKNKAK